MSMIGSYHRLSARDLQLLLDEPDRLTGTIYPDVLDDREPRFLDIDKSWHAIHFLLNRDTWEGADPYFNAVLGGALVSDEDLGYGPARYLTPVEVQVLADALSQIPRDALLTRYRADELNAAGIYPECWTDSREDGEYIGRNYDNLVEFFRVASSRDEAILLWLS